MTLDRRQFQNQLVPLLRQAALLATGGAAGLWQVLVDETRFLMEALLPFSVDEAEFLNRLLDHGEIKPQLLTDDEPLTARIAQHPLLKWKALNVRQRGSR